MFTVCRKLFVVQNYINKKNRKIVMLEWSKKWNKLKHGKTKDWLLFVDGCKGMIKQQFFFPTGRGSMKILEASRSRQQLFIAKSVHSWSMGCKYASCCCDPLAKVGITKRKERNTCKKKRCKNKEENVWRTVEDMRVDVGSFRHRCMKI